jgi:hypothetical protein
LVITAARVVVTAINFVGAASRMPDFPFGYCGNPVPYWFHLPPRFILFTLP